MNDILLFGFVNNKRTRTRYQLQCNTNWPPNWKLKFETNEDQATNKSHSHTHSHTTHHSLGSSTLYTLSHRHTHTNMPRHNTTSSSGRELNIPFETQPQINKLALKFNQTLSLSPSFSVSLSVSLCVSTTNYLLLCPYYSLSIHIYNAYIYISIYI